MKTIEDLKRLRDKVQAQTNLRHSSGTQVIVGMGTCGIAAGAREVMSALLDEIAKRKIQNVIVRQTGCIGICSKEVLVDVVRPGEPRITYGNVTKSDIPRIVTEHIVNGCIVNDLVIGKITE
ncbi:(2Fe-2S) ferredoxin domain-containing protein [Dendrosporobacter sp. 1207_IL3150]|uniref:(2Fe-2S) ferredoxin domain-containing protein n=1 Tax=Dendrosporobacter sp. 1207_IL3150 TaxID=3084054 RepID=UPI002FD950E0